MTAADGETEQIPPTEDRVRQRAWALSAVICRAFVETFDDVTEADSLHQRVIDWIEAISLRPEFERKEFEMIEAEVGSIDRRSIVNGTWRSEGLAVLAWALGTCQVPSHDEMVDPYEVASSLLFLVDEARERAGELRLRSASELDQFALQQRAVHWRIHEFSLRPEAMNFREFAAHARAGTLSLEGVALAGDDLAIDGMPIVQAPEKRFRVCQSIATERHQAINWLRGGHPVYSQVEVST